MMAPILLEISLHQVRRWKLRSSKLGMSLSSLLPFNFIMSSCSFPFNVTEAAVNSQLFPSPNGADPLENLFNVTSRVGTDGEFR